MKTIMIEKEKMPVLASQLMDANKKLARIGQELTIVDQKESIKIVKNEDCFGTLQEEKIVIMHLTFNEPSLGVEGIRYLGTSTKAEDGSIRIYNEDPSFVLHNEEGRCDHCHTKRNRNVYHFFLQLSTGNILSIGSACVEVYYGLDLNSIVHIRETFFDMFGGDPDDDGMGKGSGSRYISDLCLNSLISVVAYIGNRITGGRWISQDIAEQQQRQATIDILRDTMNPHPAFKEERQKYNEWSKEFYAREENKTLHERVKAKLTERWVGKDSTNDFEFNIIQSLVFENRELKTRIVTLGAAAWAIHQAIFASLSRDGKKNEWIGTEGEKVSVPVIVKQANSQEGFRGNLQVLLKMETEDGCALDCYYSGSDQDFWKAQIGNKVNVQATVKKHTEYRGTKTTVLTRIKKA